VVIFQQSQQFGIVKDIKGLDDQAIDAARGVALMAMPQGENRDCPHNHVSPYGLVDEVKNKFRTTTFRSSCLKTRDVAVFDAIFESLKKYLL